MRSAGTGRARRVWQALRSCLGRRVRQHILAAVLPSVLKQDPVISIRGRAVDAHGYGMQSRVRLCAGATTALGPNYSNIGGALATGAISNLYYPRRSRRGLVFGTAAIRIGESAGQIFSGIYSSEADAGLSHRPQQN